MDRYREQIHSVIEAVGVDYPTAFMWFGKRYPCAPQELTKCLGEEQLASLLLLHLQDLLYRQFYCSGGVAYYAGTWDSGTIGHDGERFATQLSKANAGWGRWDAGWRIGTLHADAIGLIKDGLTVLVPPEMCRVEQGRGVVLGANATLRQPNGSFHFSPGFYLAYGEEPLRPAAGSKLVRVYWNITSIGAAELVRVVTRRLNGARIAFRLKLLDDPRRYSRCDAAVLYLSKASCRAFIVDHLPHIHALTAPCLNRGVPALTKEMCPGIGMAEDPGRDRSFGTDRCGVLAAGVISACRRHPLSLSARLTHVEQRFRQSGIDPAAPYLNEGSRDDYDAIVLPVSNAWSGQASGQTVGRSMDGRYLAAAHDIGRLIASTAIWHGDECNWIGALGPSVEGAASGFASLGPDLYDGTAGIALFLGRLFTATRDRKLRDTAAGAIRHSMLQVERSANTHCGFYVGTLGASVVAAQLAILLDREDLLKDARRLARITPLIDVGFDLIAGAAGRIVGYLTLAEVLKDDWSLDASRAAGRQLVATAVRSSRGASWSSGNDRGRRNLTGFSHGTAGAAFSLLELFDVEEDEQFKATAEAAFDYERSYFDRHERNWPDFREVDDQGGDAEERLMRVPYSNTWCHGAPGIALSRLRAAEVLGDERYVGEARVAIDTTCRCLSNWLESGHANYSLCHGIAGNADVVLSAVRSGVPVDSVAEGIIADAAEFGLRAYGGEPSRWPCGVGGGGANPSLMLGWAGIGYFYLRLTEDGLSTPLDPRPKGTESMGQK